MVVTAGKYADVRSRSQQTGKPRGPTILVPKKNAPPLWRQFERELREGGKLKLMLERERWRTEERIRRVARGWEGRRPNPKSDMRLVATIPARDYMRWRKTDPYFFLDDGNLRSLRRDNDSYRGLIHV